MNNSRVVLVVLLLASLLLVCGGWILRTSTPSFVAPERVISERETAPATRAEPVEEVWLMLTERIPTLVSAEEALLLVEWWSRQDRIVVETFQQLCAGIRQDGKVLVTSLGTERFLLRFPVRDTQTGGWAEFASDGRLLRCEIGTTAPEISPDSVPISPVPAETLAIACRRLIEVDPVVLTEISSKDESEWSSLTAQQGCASWRFDGRTTKSYTFRTKVNPPGSDAEGHGRGWETSAFAICIGDDGVLQKYGVKRSGGKSSVLVRGPQKK